MHGLCAAITLNDLLVAPLLQILTRLDSVGLACFGAGGNGDASLGALDEGLRISSNVHFPRSHFGLPIIAE